MKSKLGAWRRPGAKAPTLTPAPAGAAAWRDAARLWVPPLLSLTGIDFLDNDPSGAEVGAYALACAGVGGPVVTDRDVANALARGAERFGVPVAYAVGELAPELGAELVRYVQTYLRPLALAYRAQSGGSPAVVGW